MAFALPWYPMIAGLFATDTDGWPCEDVGAYIRLLNSAWINGGIRADLDAQSRVCGLDRRRFSSIWRRSLADKFKVKMPGGKLSNRKLEAIRAEQMAKTEKYENAGRAGAVARWKKTTKKEDTPMRSHYDRNAVHMPLRIRSKNKATTTTEAGPGTRERKAPEPKVGTPEFREVMEQAFRDRIDSAKMNKTMKAKATKMLDGAKFDALEHFLSGHDL